MASPPPSSIECRGTDAVHFTFGKAPDAAKGKVIEGPVSPGRVARILSQLAAAPAEARALNASFASHPRPHLQFRCLLNQDARVGRTREISVEDGRDGGDDQNGENGENGENGANGTNGGPGGQGNDGEDGKVGRDATQVRGADGYLLVAELENGHEERPVRSCP